MQWMVLNYAEENDQMPYSSIADLPASVRDNLPKHAQEIYKESFNSAYDEYAGRGAEGREETAHKVAWTRSRRSTRRMKRAGTGTRRGEANAGIKNAQSSRCEKAAQKSGSFVPSKRQLNDTARDEW